MITDPGIPSDVGKLVVDWSHTCTVGKRLDGSS